MPVDLDDIPGSAERFEREYQRAVRQMKSTLDRAASEERNTHSYTNRTGNLESHTTTSEVESKNDTDEVVLQADMPYASYVNRRGYMRIDELAERAQVEIEYLMDGIAAKMGGV